MRELYTNKHAVSSALYYTLAAAGSNEDDKPVEAIPKLKTYLLQVKQELLAVYMTSFKQFMIFLRQKNTLIEECSEELFVSYDKRTNRFEDTAAGNAEKEVLSLVRSVMPLCVTIHQLMTLRYCLLARRLEILYEMTEPPYRPLKALISENSRLDFDHDAEWNRSYIQRLKKASLVVFPLLKPSEQTLGTNSVVDNTAEFKN